MSLIGQFFNLIITYPIFNTLILDFIDETKDRIQLVSCKESIDTSTPTGKFLVTIMAGIAELERDTISARTKAALEARGHSVGIRSGQPPYGRVGKCTLWKIRPPLLALAEIARRKRRTRLTKEDRAG
jgi:DNA invertase Pin-like site-specific DNA recombinase